MDREMFDDRRRATAKFRRARRVYQCWNTNAYRRESDSHDGTATAAAISAGAGRWLQSLLPKAELASWAPECSRAPGVCNPNDSDLFGLHDALPLAEQTASNCGVWRRVPGSDPGRTRGVGAECASNHGPAPERNQQPRRPLK